MGARGWSLLVTSEHGGNDVPEEHRSLFRGRKALLDSHRGWDPGTLDLAERLASALGAPLVASSVTRLLVDLNRSPHNPRVFSEVTRPLPRAARLVLLAR
jgi:predicted N-formylglutamate amidohydrolase